MKADRREQHVETSIKIILVDVFSLNDFKFRAGDRQGHRQNIHQHEIRGPQTLNNDCADLFLQSEE